MAEKEFFVSYSFVGTKSPFIQEKRGVIESVPRIKIHVVAFYVTGYPQLITIRSLRYFGATMRMNLRSTFLFVADNIDDILADKDFKRSWWNSQTLAPGYGFDMKDYFLGKTWMDPIDVRSYLGIDQKKARLEFFQPVNLQNLNLKIGYLHEEQKIPTTLLGFFADIQTDEEVTLSFLGDQEYY